MRPATTSTALVLAALSMSAAGLPISGFRAPAPREPRVLSPDDVARLTAAEAKRKRRYVRNLRRAGA